MTFLALAAEVKIGYANWPIIKQLAQLLGLIMRGIFSVLNSMDIVSATACIVLFTVITRMLLLPLTIKQQKSSKVTALMNPELQELQRKYQGRRDQASLAKMQMEQQAIYDKYGSSMTAGCLPSLIQLPLLFALYPVIYQMEKYVPKIGELAQQDPTFLSRFYNLLGINLQEAPGWRLTWALMIPLLAGLFQFLSSKLMMVNTPDTKDNPAANSMKSMTYFMPIMSVFICVTLPAFLGVYWVVQSVVMVIQQYFINKKFDKISVEELIRQNIEAANKKRAKRGQPLLNEKATLKATKQTLEAGQAQKKTEEQLAERAKNIEQSTEYYRNRAGAGSGSLAAKANMVKEFNERNTKK